MPETSYYYFAFNKTRISDNKLMSDDDVLQIRDDSFPLAQVKRLFMDRGYLIAINNIMEIDKDLYNELLEDKEFEVNKYEYDEYEGIYFL
jgi:hypothetical protein